MNSAIKYRLYPTSEQKIMFAKTFGCCRKVYNLMLSEKIESYKTTGKFVAVTPAKYKKDFPYLKEVDSLALANVQLNLQNAFRNRFDRNRRKKTGFPKFKSAKHSRKSYTTNNQNGTVAIIDNRYIRLPKIGKIKAVIHRVPAQTGNSGQLLFHAAVTTDTMYQFSSNTRIPHRHMWQMKIMPSVWTMLQMGCMWMTKET